MAWHHAIAHGEIDEARIKEAILAFKILQQRHTLDTPMAKPRYKWPESS